MHLQIVPINVLIAALGPHIEDVPGPYGEHCFSERKGLGGISHHESCAAAEHAHILSNCKACECYYYYIIIISYKL